MKPPFGNRHNPFDVDKYNLDDELELQANLIRYYAEQHAEAEDAYDRAERNVKVVEAEVEVLIRKLPEKFGLEKLTEGVVKAHVTIHQLVKDAYEKMFTLKHRLKMLVAAVKSAEHKKAAVHDLVSLYDKSYWADKPSKENSRVVRDREITSTFDARKRLERKRERESSGEEEVDD